MKCSRVMDALESNLNSPTSEFVRPPLPLPIKIQFHPSSLIMRETEKAGQSGNGGQTGGKGGGWDRVSSLEESPDFPS